MRARRGAALNSTPSFPQGAAREQEIYQLGLAGKKISVPLLQSRLEEKAKEILDPRAYDYIAGGAGGELTMRANLEAFYRWRTVPRMLRDVSQRDLSVELLGTRIPAPVLLGPVGLFCKGHADHQNLHAFPARRSS